MVSRRNFVKSMLALGAAGTFPPLLACEAETDHYFSAAGYRPGTAVTPLKQLAAAAGMKFGSAFDMASVNDAAYGQLLKHHCDILTTDYQFKFWTLRPAEDRISFARADQIMEFARQAAIPVRGHTLIWNEWNPPWLNELSSARVRYWLERHIDEVAGRYAGRFHSWDVVNEPMWPDHKKELGLRSGAWLRAMGPDYVKKAFELTAKADPAAKRVLNEAWLERGDHWGAGLRKSFLPFIDRLLQQGTPLDAVGLQCHLAPGNLAMDEFLAIVEQLKAWKLEVYVTELDVNDQSFTDDPLTRDHLVARVYQDFLRELFNTGAISMVQTWQLSDKYSFYQDRQERKVRVLPFDSCMRKKPAYDALAAAFAAVKSAS
ncbi:endo-1,4-beta-xylanase [Chromatiaceae bacterium AAb-1]|nr:endo-1,4-beta-xylanase [Chromatiaceae bacterium AAb-1]